MSLISSYLADCRLHGRSLARQGLVIAALTAGISVLTTARADAQRLLSFGVGGGVTFPLGTISNTYETGYNILAFAALGSKDSPLNFRFDGMWNDLGNKSSVPVSNQQMWTLNGNVVFNIGADTIGKTIEPYLIGGVGYYNTSYNVVATGGTLTSSGNIHANSLGINAGLGLHIGKGRLHGFIESRYHYVFVGNHNFQFLPVTAGLGF